MEVDDAMEAVSTRTRSRARTAAEMAGQGIAIGGTAERRAVGAGRQGVGRAMRQRVARVAAVDIDMLGVDVSLSWGGYPRRHSALPCRIIRREQLGLSLL